MSNVEHTMWSTTVWIQYISWYVLAAEQMWLTASSLETHDSQIKGMLSKWKTQRDSLTSTQLPGTNLCHLTRDTQNHDQGALMAFAGWRSESTGCTRGQYGMRKGHWRVTLDRASCSKHNGFSISTRTKQSHSASKLLVTVRLSDELSRTFPWLNRKISPVQKKSEKNLWIQSSLVHLKNN